jgi:signal transduction histidine kinase
LHALDRLERLVIETAQTGVVGPALQLQMAALKHDGLLYHASSLLMDHLAESHTRGVNFVEAISHQLRSPLASVLGFGAVLADPLTRPTDAEVERYAQIIVSQSGRMDQLIEKMLSAARIEAGQLDVTREPLHLRTLAVTVIEETKQQSRREIILKDDLGSAVCWGDALRLREVFLNLIENALKYSTLDTPVHVILQRAEAGNWAEIMVTDQGIGIAQNELPGLFTRFGRIRNEQTRGIPGNGLGLYIVKYIVERHNGSILVHSQPGQGTKFTVRLPLE